MKKCILFVLSFVLLSTGLSIGYSGNAAAITEEDLGIIRTDTLPLGGANAAMPYHEQCDQVEFKNLIYNDVLSTDPNKEYSHYNVWNSNHQRMRQFIDRFRTNTNSDDFAGYGVSHFGSSNQDDIYETIRLYAFDSDTNFFFTNRNGQLDYYNLISDKPVEYLDIFFNANAPACRYQASNVQTTSYSTLWPGYPINYSGGSYQHKWYQLASDNITYPDGYTGSDLDVVIGGGGDEGSLAHKPNITWDVMDKNVTVYSDSAKNTATLEDYQIYWFITNSTFDTRQPSEPFALSGCTPPDFNNNFTVPINFDYGVQAYYADEDCNILQVDDEGEQLTENMVVLRIDGSNFNGSTDDHVAIIGEIAQNPVLKAIQKFRPNNGGLASLIFAPIEAVATLPDIVGTCTPISLPLLGQNVSLKCIRPTIQNSPMGPVYSVISVIITGMVTWFVAWRTFGTIKNIQDPQDDKVEVLKL